MTEEQMNQYIKKAIEAKDAFPDDPMEVNWLDAVPFDKDGNPTGEVNDYVVNRGNWIIADGLKEQEAEKLLDFLIGALEEMNKMLNELYNLTIREEEVSLTEEESARYVHLFDTLKDNGVEIPFGVNI